MAAWFRPFAGTLGEAPRGSGISPEHCGKLRGFRVIGKTLGIFGAPAVSTPKSINLNFYLSAPFYASPLYGYPIQKRRASTTPQPLFENTERSRHKKVQRWRHKEVVTSMSPLLFSKMILDTHGSGDTEDATSL